MVNKINLRCILGGILYAKQCNMYFKEIEKNQLGDINKW
jgi:hypothetical protein